MFYIQFQCFWIKRITWNSARPQIAGRKNILNENGATQKNQIIGLFIL